MFPNLDEWTCFSIYVDKQEISCQNNFWYFHYTLICKTILPTKIKLFTLLGLLICLENIYATSPIGNFSQSFYIYFSFDLKNILTIKQQYFKVFEQFETCGNKCTADMTTRRQILKSLPIQNMFEWILKSRKPKV